MMIYEIVWASIVVSSFVSMLMLAKKVKKPTKKEIFYAFFVGTPEYERFSRIGASAFWGEKNLERWMNMWDKAFDKIENVFKKKGVKK